MAATTSSDGDSENDADVAKLPFVRKMAATDKKMREKGLSMLTKWLMRRKDVPVKTLKRVWKGLFYCMWHADKPPVQYELASSMSQLLLKLEVPLAVRFFSVFVETMRREWSGIDRLRMDKFYRLIRSFLGASFSLLCQKKWSVKIVKKFMNALQAGTLLPSDNYAGLGINLHLADIYVEELIVRKKLDEPGTLLLFEPFVVVLTLSKEKGLLNRVSENIFGKLIDLSKSCIEAQALSGGNDAMSGLCLKDVQSLKDDIFNLASAPDTAGLNRKYLYGVHGSLSVLWKLLSKSPDSENGEKVSDDNEKESSAVDSSSEKLKAKPKNSKSKGLRKSAQEKSNGVTEANDGNLIASDFQAAPWPDVVVIPDTIDKAESKRNDLTADSEDSSMIANEPKVREPNDKAKTGKKKKAAKLKKKESLEVSPKLPEVATDEVVTSKAAEVEKPREGELRTNLTSIFESIQTSPPKTRSRVKRKAEEAAKKGKDTEKKEPQKVAAKPAIKAATFSEPSEEKRVKRVKFDLKCNLAFAKNGPVPPPSLRTPPNAAPKGSALKRGVKPGPIDKAELKKSLNLLEKFESDQAPDNRVAGRRRGRK